MIWKQPEPYRIFVMSPGVKEAKKKRAAERRAGKRAERKRLSREHRYVAWKHLSRNQKEVATRLAHGEGCDYIHDGSWGFFDRFMLFLKSVGYLATLDLDGKGYTRKMITIAKLLLTYQTRILLGIDSINKVPFLLFGDIGLLMTLGWTARQIKEGVCKRGEGKHDGPVHKDTLPDCLERMGAEEITRSLNDGIKLLKTIGVAGFRTFDEYRDPQRKRAEPDPINAVMVTCWDGYEYKPGKEKVFLTSLNVGEPRVVIDKYDLRSLIENCGNRDLKQGWLINKYPKKEVNAIRAHVFLTIGMFNMSLAYRTEQGEQIAEECIRRYRMKTMLAARHKCMIVCGEHYGIFDLEELMMLLGQPVRRPMRTQEEAFRRIYGL
ncbi:MAG: hypothetical protein R6V03_02950 [Kiritimatiellia bacterium]